MSRNAETIQACDGPHPRASVGLVLPSCVGNYVLAKTCPSVAAAEEGVRLCFVVAVDAASHAL